MGLREISEKLLAFGVTDPRAAEKAISRTSTEHVQRALTWVASMAVTGPDGRTVYPYPPETIHNRLVTKGAKPTTEEWGDPDDEWSRLRTAQTERAELERQQLRQRVERMSADELERRHGAEVDKLDIAAEKRRLVKESREWQVARDRDIRRELLVRAELGVHA